MTIFLAFAEGSIQLVPDGTILLHILFLLIMVAILNKVLFRPVAQIISEREGRNRANLKHAAELEFQIESGIKRHREALREARARGYKLMEEKRNEALRERAGKIESLKKEIDERVREESVTIEGQAESARRLLDTTTLAATIRDQILKTSGGSPKGN